MTARSEFSALRKSSPLFWFTLVVPVAIITIGVNFIVNPTGSSAACGIPIHDPEVFPYMWIIGIRGLFTGLVILLFLLRGDVRATAAIFSVAVLIPVGDGLVILRQLGLSSHLLIHWGTALYMAIIAVLLFRTSQGGWKGSTRVRPRISGDE